MKRSITQTQLISKQEKPNMFARLIVIALFVAWGAVHFGVFMVTAVLTIASFCVIFLGLVIFNAIRKGITQLRARWTYAADEERARAEEIRAAAE